MNNLDTILLNQGSKEHLLELFKQVVDSTDPKLNSGILKMVEKQISSLSPEAKKIFDQEFAGFIALLKWRALPLLKEGQILDLLEKNIVVTRKFLEDGYDENVFDLNQAIKNYLLTIIDFEERDKFKALAKTALLANKEVLDPNHKIKSVAEWFRHIIAQIGLEFDGLKENEFYLKDPDFLSLNSINRAVLKNIFNLYKACLRSSLTAVGMEETVMAVVDGKIRLISQGVMEEVIVPESTLGKGVEAASPGQKKVLPQDKYSFLSSHFNKLSKDLINQDQLKIFRIKSAGFDELVASWIKALTKKDRQTVLAGLGQIIEAKILASLLSQKDFQESFGEWVQKKYPVLSRGSLDALTPETYSLLMQYILVEKLGYQPEEAAIITLYFANQLAKTGQEKYLSAIYGDAKTGFFNWRELEVKDGQLRFSA